MTYFIYTNDQICLRLQDGVLNKGFFYVAAAFFDMDLKSGN